MLKPSQRLESISIQQTVSLAAHLHEFPHLRRCRSHTLLPEISRQIPRNWSRKLSPMPYDCTRIWNCSCHPFWLHLFTCTFLADDDGHDHAVNAEDTGHDDGDQRFHHYWWSPNRNAANAGACFGSPIGCSEICIFSLSTRQHQGHAHSHEPEKWCPVDKIRVGYLSCLSHFN